MKLRWKNILLGLSVWFCLLSIVGWGFGMAGRGFQWQLPKMGGLYFSISGFGGGIGLAMVQPHHFWEKTWIGQLRYADEKRIFVTLSFSGPNDAWLWNDWGILLPYWLLILLFGVPPAFWWRRRYVERRDQKFFEQIVAEKRAENPNIEIQNPKERGKLE